MKKVFLINFPQSEDDRLGLKLNEALTRRQVNTERVHAVDFIMDLGDGAGTSAKLISKEGVPVDVSSNIFFMKRRRPIGQMTTFRYSAVFLRFVSLLGGDVLNQCFLDHDRTSEKPSQYINLIKHGFRIPRSIMVHESRINHFREYIESTFVYPCVLKASGSCGRSVWKISRFEDIEAHLSSIADSKRKEVVIIQEFIPTSHEEFRALVFLGKIVAVIRRSSESFYNNHAQGGHVDTGVLTPDETQLVLEAGRISGLDYVGVDFMRNRESIPTFIELQTGPSLTVSEMVNPTIVEDMAELLMKRTRGKEIS